MRKLLVSLFIPVIIAGCDPFGNKNNQSSSSDSINKEHYSHRKASLKEGTTDPLKLKFIRKTYKNREVQSVEAHLQHSVAAGGTTEVAFLNDLSSIYSGEKVGIMVAGNSGLAGGNIAYFADNNFRNHLGVSVLHAAYTTQEEDMVSNWLLTEDFVSSKPFYSSFNLIKRKWGMINERARDNKTIQGVDYVNTTTPINYGDAWVVKDVHLSKKRNGAFILWDSFPASLVFVAGPNAYSKGKPTGSMARTLNKKAQSESYPFPFFTESVEATVRVALDAMIANDMTVAYLARASGGIYAGPDALNSYRDTKAYQRRNYVFENYPTMINKVLDEAVGPNGEKRRSYFTAVHLVDLFQN